MIRFAVLGSGSKGNATLVEAGGKRVLIDAGLSAKQLTNRLKERKVCPDSIDAILLTHEHGDHIGGLDVFLKTREVPVYTTPLTQETIAGKFTRSKPSWKLFQPGGSFEIGELRVRAFSIPHDAVDPVGYRLETAHHSFAFLSDLGFGTTLAKTALRGVDAAFVEANYDEQLLEEDMKRPWSTKQRIASRHGHLSNKQTAELVAEVGCTKLRYLVLGHLSSDCNTVNHAVDTVGVHLRDKAGLEPEIYCAIQDEPTPWFELHPPAPPKPKHPVLETDALDQGEWAF